MTPLTASAFQPHTVPETPAARAQVRQSLLERVADDPHQEIAWYELSRAAETPVEGLECLVRVLEMRAAGSALPGGHTRLGQRLRALAARVERRPVTPLSRAASLAWYTLTAALLLVLALVVGPMAVGARTVIIISGSMEPAIHTGSAVIARPVPSASLRVGDVIVFAPDANATIPKVHRIKSIREEEGQRYYTTQGDANENPDPGELTLGGTAWRVWYALPAVGYAVAWGTSRAGMIALIVVPLVGLVGMAAVDWLRKDR